MLQKLIDYLKFDIELSEWTSLESMLSDGVLTRVKQLGMEIHTSTIAMYKQEPTAFEYRYYLTILEKLHAAGFRQWYIHRNPYCKKFVPDELYDCFEMVFININFLDNFVPPQN